MSADIILLIAAVSCSQFLFCYSCMISWLMK